MSNPVSNDLGRVRHWVARALIGLGTGCGLHESPDVDDGPRLGGTGGEAGDGQSGEFDDVGVGEPGAAGVGADGAGAREPTTLAEGTFDSLAIGSGYLYVIDVGGDPRIARVSALGGPVEPLSGAPSGLYRIVADDTNLYGAIFFTPTRSEFWRAPLANGGFTPEQGGVLLGEAHTSAALAVNPSSLISLEARPSGRTVARDLTHFDKAASAPGGSLLANVELVFADALALDEEAAFVVNGAEGPSFVVRIPLDGSGAAVIAQAPPGGTLSDVSVGGERAVFASDVGVGAAPIRGGETTWITPESAHRVLADSERAYYFSCEGATDIYRVPLGGGIPFRIGREPLGCVVDVVQDADSLYWLTPDGRSIRRLAKE